MSFTILASGLSWYDRLLEHIPEGHLFSWRAVFDAMPSIIERVPVMLGLTLGGAVLVFCSLCFLRLSKSIKPKSCIPFSPLL